MENAYDNRLEHGYYKFSTQYRKSFPYFFTVFESLFAHRIAPHRVQNAISGSDMDMICVIVEMLVLNMSTQAALHNSKAVNKIETNVCVQIREKDTNQLSSNPTSSARIMNRSYIEFSSIPLSLSLSLAPFPLFSFSGSLCACERNSNRYIPKIQMAWTGRSWFTAEQTMRDGSCSGSCSCFCSYHLRINMRTVSHSIIFHKCTVNLRVTSPAIKWCGSETPCLP